MKFNKIITVFAFFIGLTLSQLAQTSEFVVHSAQQKPDTVFSPENTTFAWDVDGVLVNRNGGNKEFMQLFWNELSWWNKIRAIKFVIWLYFYGHEGHKKADELHERYALEYLARYNPVLKTKLPSGKTVADRLFEIHVEKANWFDTNGVLKDLDALGYSLAIATNIHSDTLLPLFKTERSPYKADDFVHIHAADSTVNQTGTKLIKKPAAAYYQDMGEKCREGHNLRRRTPSRQQDSDKQHQVIFIDDKQKNVAAAAQEGNSAKVTMTGIHYTGTPQLRASLESLGIFENKKNV